MSKLYGIDIINDTLEDIDTMLRKHEDWVKDEINNNKDVNYRKIKL